MFLPVEDINAVQSIRCSVIPFIILIRKHLSNNINMLYQTVFEEAFEEYTKRSDSRVLA